VVSDTLWLRVGEDVSLPGPLTHGEEGRLSSIFSATGSPWARACERFALAVPSETFLRFVKGVPYVNAGALTLAISHGTVRPERGTGESVEYKARRGILATARLLRSQWRLESFLGRLSAELPRGQVALEESVALGLAVQLLLLRLPARDEASLARWLANPGAAPLALRATLLKLQSVQLRRTRLSHAWGSVYENVTRAPTPDLPTWFWNEPAFAVSANKTEEKLAWKGIPICPGEIEAPLFANVLVFRHARPDTVEQFERATALLFAEGGALAHACCVARERGIPCVSGLGAEFYRQVEAWRAAGVKARARVNGATGEVRLIKE
jgi:hypothetical protein